MPEDFSIYPTRKRGQPMEEKLLTIIFYRGKRINNTTIRIDRVESNESGEFPTPLQHYDLHSPTGMEWGYGGSGPADLALAILLDYFQETPTLVEIYNDVPKAMCVYHQFKWDFVSKWDDDEWEITHGEISLWLHKPEQQRRLTSHAEARAAYDAIREEAADGN